MSIDRKLSEIRQIALVVSDIEAALGFYRDILGLAFLFSAGPELAFLDAGGIRIMLTTPKGHGSVGTNSILYFKVSRVDETYSALIARGATSERAPQLTA
ncbi:MAG TPA: VOC family protein, partial [Gemmataceae bacterium]|nr:VOC family protein [Gemmataceae bacterium]